MILGEGGAHDHPGRAEHRQNGAELNEQVGWGPEAVPANGLMPGDVPVEPTGNADGSYHIGPDQPGNFPGSGRARCFSHTRPLSEVLQKVKSALQEYTEWPFSHTRA